MNNFQNKQLYIGSLQNERVKQWASLLDKKYRDRTNQFIIEGVHLIQEALKAGAEVKQIVFDEERGLPHELKEESYASTPGIEWVSTSKAIMAKCTGTDTPPPVFAVLNKLEISEEKLFGEDSLIIVLDGVRDPGNLGTIIRSADAAGADAVVLGKGCVDLYNPKSVRSTMGSLFHLPIVEGDLSELLPKAKAHGATLVGTSLQAEHSCYSYNWKRATWLLMGNESEGLSQHVREQLDEAVIIPMAGRAESLNVAMASTILLFEALRQRGV
ncbi:RNA methyltransferase [Paenibacillus sp. GSMTC-2017]|uniref:TrmH family RNA methyltransferase n=1 Tax=Paenibacillus sp. GSMTC-2017 TaxID=2794350 RepID=UPI0018D8EC3F|nr:RNA methyltransferase [Paenibacillus sp. GSMTC-2017]MBH5317547.1 RNA methyltransferase [Paenibacillus sp. GSMTC-2017]